MMIEQIIEIVKEASRLMVREGFDIMQKDTHANLVTTSDLAVQDFLTHKLGGLLPGSGFLCEEDDLRELDHEYIWIIDPIDGTTNYSRSQSDCCISVALTRNWIPEIAVVYSPWRNELYTACKGGGAFCNGKPIHVSARPYEDSLFYSAMSTYRKDLSKACSGFIYDVFMEVIDIRRLGSAALELCCLAAGYAELFFEIRLHPWDYAGAGLILQEAGGVLGNFDGQAPSLRQADTILAANSAESLGRLQEMLHRHLDKRPY